jgi:hypothetical protein
VMVRFSKLFTHFNECMSMLIMHSISATNLDSSQEVMSKFLANMSMVRESNDLILQEDSVYTGSVRFILL